MITSLQNPKIKEAVKLRNKRVRDRSGLFLVEGFRETSRALTCSWEFVTFFYAPGFFLGENELKILEEAKSQGAQLLECSSVVFEKLSYRDRPDGLLAVVKSKSIPLQEIKSCVRQGKTPFFVVCEAIEKPGNLGTILRTCDAVGADALIVCDQCTDLFNPNVVRASVGTLFSVPVVETSSKEARLFLENEGIQTVAATPHATLLHTEADLAKPVAVCFGTEQYGLSQEWLEGAEIQVQIPMKGVADSLNVAISTGVLLYEVLRQRG